MKWTMRRACEDCPFRRSRRFPLHRRRMLAICDDVKQGNVFCCHKTTGKPQSRWRACAGWLLYQRHNRQDNAAMQLAERFGVYRPRLLDDDPDVMKTRAEIESAEWFTDRGERRD